ncbi:MAG: UGSC family (seleno)protein, partial [Acidimicrobiales bacterium]
TYMGSQGNGYQFTNLTFAENEGASPWEPFHVEHGFAPGDSTVSIWIGAWSTSFMHGIRPKYWQNQVRNLLRGMDPVQAPLLVLDPIAARELVEHGGFESKEGLLQWIWQNALMPAGEFWDNEMVQTLMYPQAQRGIEPWASNLRADEAELVRMFPREMIKAVVSGGETCATWRMICARYRGTFSVDEWR